MEAVAVLGVVVMVVEGKETGREDGIRALVW